MHCQTWICHLSYRQKIIIRAVRKSCFVLIVLAASSPEVVSHVELEPQAWRNGLRVPDTVLTVSVFALLCLFLGLRIASKAMSWYYMIYWETHCLLNIWKSKPIPKPMICGAGRVAEQGVCHVMCHNSVQPGMCHKQSLLEGAVGIFKFWLSHRRSSSTLDRRFLSTGQQMQCSSQIYLLIYIYIYYININLSLKKLVFVWNICSYAISTTLLTFVRYILHVVLYWILWLQQGR